MKMNPNFQQLPLELWYKKPAPDTLEGWESWALPLGCGYLGAKVFGGVQTERIQITENSLANPYRPGLNNFAETYIDFPHKQWKNYRRSLSLDDAVARVSYDCDGIRYTREYFASYPDQVLAMRFDASEPGCVSFELRPEVPYVCDWHSTPGDGMGKSGNLSVAGNTVRLTGQMEYYQINFEGQYRVIPSGGTVTPAAHGLRVDGADSAVILLAVGTNYHMTPEVFLKPDREKLDPNELPGERVHAILDRAQARGWNALLHRHLADYRALFGRVSLSLGADRVPDRPTDALLRRYRRGAHDPYLEALYFQYGRYLLIVSSRKGCLPANLQGIWNVHNDSPWSAGYWHNINQQMNYWPAFPANLAELFESYCDFNETFRPAAQRKADEYLEQIGDTSRAPAGTGENGWIIGTGVWPYALEGLNPASHSGPGTGAFTALLFWDYYDFTRDETVLREHTYPALLGMAKFLSHILTERDGLLLASPSASPEQRKGEAYYHTVGCAFDQQMIYENTKRTLNAAALLGEQGDFLDFLRDALDRLDPVQIGASGQIKEFREENKYGEIGEKRHRHISQLVGLYPGMLITAKTPEWMAAAKRTLRLRGDRSTGWAMAHRLNAWARTGGGKRAYRLYRLLLRKGTLPNLWDTHPPFQIDGNFGGTSGVAEMLLQSHEGCIRPLPALPPQWRDGSFQGLVARGNFVVDAAWRNGRLTELTVHSRAGAPCVVEYPGIASLSEMPQGRGADTALCERVGNDRLILHLRAGETYRLRRQSKVAVK